MMPPVKWWAGWYCKVLHAVPHDAPDDSYEARAVCGNVYARPWMRLKNNWQLKKIEAGIPKCKTCLRMLGVES